MSHPHFRFLPLLGLAALFTACSGTHLEVPAPGEEHYTALNPVAIHAVSSQEIYVTGSLTRPDGTPEGLVLASETGGRTWRRVAFEVHDLGRTTFQCVFFADRLRGWVGGLRVDDRGRTRPLVLRTRDGGNHWRETRLVQDPDAVATQVHGLAFTSDLEGTVSVAVRDPETGEARRTVFVTQDGGRSWTASQWREEAEIPFQDHSVSMIDEERGFRLRGSRFPGVHLVEATVSEGRDWMPVSELTLSALSTYY